MKPLLIIILLIPSSILAQKNDDMSLLAFNAIFFSDSTFQIGRTQFPLEIISIDSDSSTKEITFVEQSEWDHIDIGLFKFDIKTQSELGLKEANGEICYESEVNKFKGCLFFKKIEGNWNLVKVLYTE